MSSLTWLHLSDWHQRLGEFDRQVVLDSLLADIRNRTKISSSLERVDLIIFSGDIANTGKKEEYDAAASYLLDPILESTGVSRDRLFFVPGNHDLDRTSFRLLPDAILRPFTSSEEVQQWLVNQRERERLLEPFEAFSGFVGKYTGQPQPAFSSVSKFDVGGKTVALLGINSALMCGRNKDTTGKVNDYGYLIVGEPQIHDALNQIAEAHVRIAVLHHPFSWLTLEEHLVERSIIESRLYKTCHFILHGHEHEANVIVRQSPGGDCIVIPAGASYDRREPTSSRYANAYNFVHMDFISGQANVYLRKYDDRQGWIKDTGMTGDVNPGIWTFALPRTLITPTSKPSSTPPELSTTSQVSSLSVSTETQYWGEAPNVETLYGRDAELAELQQWVITEQCHLIGIFGMGGIGKSTVATKLAKQLTQQFDYIIWTSLLNAPPVDDILVEYIHLLSSQQEIELPDGIDKKTMRLIEYMRISRCLIILDNFDTVFSKGQTGQYISGYEEFGRFIQLIGECNHKSCVLLTSREKPSEFALLEGKSSTVRSFPLKGLEPQAGQEMLWDKGLVGNDDAWRRLVEHYAGNPLTLKLVSETIVEVFNADIGRFLEEGATNFNEVYDLLEEQFDRLSELEQSIMYWLAVEREPVSFHDLRSNIARPVRQRDVSHSIKSLRRRSLIERSEAGFTLQNVVMEYTTDRLIDAVCDEIVTGELLAFENQAIMKAQSVEYIREAQIRLILTPVVETLLTGFGSEKEVENRLKQLLVDVKRKLNHKSGYIAGNILNILGHLNADISGCDFSGLPIWEAYLRGTNLHDVKFMHSDLKRAVFTEIFGTHLSVAFNPTGELLTTGTTNGEIRFWRSIDGRPLRTFIGHVDWVRTVSFSPDGQLLASGGEDQTVRVWDFASGRCIRVFQGHTNRVRMVVFSPDGKMLVSCSSDNTIRLWDIENARNVKIIEGHTDWVRSVAFHPNGEMLISCSSDKTLRLWDVSTGGCLRVFEGHTDWVRSVAFHPNGTMIASGSSDNTVRLWNVSTGKCLKILQGHTNRVRAVAFSPDGNTLASGSGDQTIRLWNVHSGQCFETLHGHSSQVWSVAFSPDSSTLASCSEDQTARLWDISTGHCLKVLQGYTPPIWSVAFSPKDDLLASGSGDQIVRLWDIPSRQCLRVLRGHTSWIRSVSFSPNGTLLASGSDDQTVRVWNVKTGECIRVLEGHINRVRSVAFNRDGKLLASGSKGQKIWLWRVTTGKFLQTLEGHTNPVWSVAFSPNEDRLASGSGDYTVRVWDTLTGACLCVLQGHTNWVRSVTFSPDGRMLASGGEDGTVRLWNIDSKECLKTFRDHTERVWSVAFSSDGQLLASGSDDQTIRVWNISTGTCLNTLQGQNSQIRAVAFSRDGYTLASGSYDGSIMLWNVQTGETLGTLHSDRPYERMNITGAIGLTDAQKSTLKALGAIENA